MRVTDEFFLQGIVYPRRMYVCLTQSQATRRKRLECRSLLCATERRRYKRSHWSEALTDCCLAGESCSAEGFCWFCYRAVLQTRCSGISKPHTGLINMRSLSDRVICIYSGFQSPHRQPQSMEQLRWQDLSRWTRGHVLRCWLSFSCARIPRLSSYGVSKPLLFMEERVSQRQADYSKNSHTEVNNGDGSRRASRDDPFDHVAVTSHTCCIWFTRALLDRLEDVKSASGSSPDNVMAHYRGCGRSRMNLRGRGGIGRIL